MKCPTCGGTGEVGDPLVKARPGATGGLANRTLVPTPDVSRYNRVESAVHRLDKSAEMTERKSALDTWRTYILFLYSRGGKASSQEICDSLWQAPLSELAGRHRTLRSLCRMIHSELTFEMLLTSTTERSETRWEMTPFAEKIMRPVEIIDAKR